MSDDDLTATSDDAAHDCDNCGAMMDEEDLVMHCPATFCPHVYCRHCVPVWCDGCGRLIGPDPAKTTPNPDRGHDR